MSDLLGEGYFDLELWAYKLNDTELVLNVRFQLISLGYICVYVNRNSICLK